VVADSAFRHGQVEVDGLSIHVVDGGRDAARSALLFLHGWPQDWSAFGRVMTELVDTHHVVAIDLPGVGRSIGRLPSNDKRTIAHCVRHVIAALGLQRPTLVGHDIGAQVVFAFLLSAADALSAAVMMNIVVPGIEPWAQVIRNPHMFHFAFHAVAELPELLVSGHEARYFDYFFDALTRHRDGVGGAARRAYVAAYARADALSTGFDWYRAFAQDEQDNQQGFGRAVHTPVLYLRGQHERGDIHEYLLALRDAGLRRVHGELIAESGHFAPDEAPAAVAAAIRRFVDSVRRAEA